jgi:hypothetical protein
MEERTEKTRAKTQRRKGKTAFGIAAKDRKENKNSSGLG